MKKYQITAIINRRVPSVLHEVLARSSPAKKHNFLLGLPVELVGKHNWKFIQFFLGEYDLFISDAFSKAKHKRKHALLEVMLDRLEKQNKILDKLFTCNKKYLIRDFLPMVECNEKLLRIVKLRYGLNGWNDNI